MTENLNLNLKYRSYFDSDFSESYYKLSNMAEGKANTSKKYEEELKISANLKQMQDAN